MRILIVIVLVALLPACAAPTPALGPPMSAASPVAPVSAPPSASEARIQGVVITENEAQAVEAAASVPIAGTLAFVCWVAPANAPSGDISGKASALTRPPGRALAPWDLAGFGLDRAAAIAVAEANLRAGLRPAESVLRPLPGAGIGVDSGDFAEAGRLVLVDEWAALAASVGGHLLVAAPAADTLLYADGRAPGALEVLQARAAAVMRQSARPISTAILEWNPDGWQLAAPGGPQG